MVDSGNLAGHLLVMRRGLLGLTDGPILPPRIFEGLRDTLRVLLDVARGLHRPGDDGSGPLASSDLLRKIEALEEELVRRERTVSGALAFLARLLAVAREITAAAGTIDELEWWAKSFEGSCAQHREDILYIAAWAEFGPSHEVWGRGSPEQARRLEKVREMLGQLDGGATLRQVAALQSTVVPALDEMLAPLHQGDSGAVGGADESSEWLVRLRQAVADSSQRATGRIKALEQAAQDCGELAEMDFSFLFDKSRDLFAIGYNVADQRLDGSFYDLLASEARLGSFVAIAQGQLGQDHWFALGRMLTYTGGVPALLSWSGSMFEYLMPLLVMPTYDNTVLDQTYKAVVRRQIHYGRQRGVPWGISESGYNTTDAQSNYQYRAFGVPGLGLKRGLAEDLVIAPYASVMALMVAPEAATRNLERLDADGQTGAYGLYEAIDYTPSRLPRGAASVTVKQFMAHHQGMSLLSLAYLLLDRPMQKRFESDPMLRGADLLLQERVPKASAAGLPPCGRGGRARDRHRAGAGDDAHLHRSRRHRAGGASAVQRAVSRRDNQRGRRV